MLGFFYVIKQYERGVQFRLGRVRDGVRGPGVILVIPLVDRVRRVSLRIVTLPIESQGIITRDKRQRRRLRRRLLPRRGRGPLDRGDRERVRGY